MAKNSFILYHDKASMFYDLPDKQCADLIRAIFKYETEQTLPADAITLGLLQAFKPYLDKNRVEWEESAKVKRANGKLGGRPRKEQEKPRETENNLLGFSETYDNLLAPVTVSVTEGQKNIDDFFETVWKIYPHKKGKGAVKLTQRKKLYKLGYDVITKCINRYKTSKPEWQQWQNGGTFFNSGYIDYLDENYQSSENKQERKLLE